MITPDQLRMAVPYIEASLARSNPSGNTLQDVLNELATGRARLWLGPDSAAVTQHVATERIWHAAGSMESLVDSFQKAWPVMQSVGIERLAIENTRKGWAKQLKPHGFQQVLALIKEA